MRIFVCTLFVITMAMTAFGQNKECTHDLTIIVIDSDTKHPIEGVTAYISNDAQITHSDSNGEIHFKNLCLAPYEIELRHLNHQPHKESILITKNKQTKQVILNCHMDTLKAITILGKKSNFQKEILMMSKLKADDLFKSQSFSIGKSLEKINGVYNLNTGNHIQKPIVRGLYGNRVLVIHNDIRQEGQQWGNEHAPEVDALSIKEVELIKGAQSIEYGSDAIGGVIILKPKSIYKITKTNGEIISGYNTNGRGFAQSLMIEGTLNKMKSLTWRMQGDFKKSGNTKTPDYFLKNTGMNELNASAALGYQSQNFKLSIHQTFFKSKIGIFSGSHIGNITDLYNAFHASKPVDSSGFSYLIEMPYQSIIHQTTKAEMIYQFKKLGSLKSTFAYQKNNRDEYEKTTSTLQSDGSYKPSLRFLLNTYQFDLKFLQSTQSKWQGVLGVSNQYQTNEYFGSYLIPNYQKNTAGLYMIEKANFHSLFIEVGARFDLNQFAIQKWDQNILINRTHSYKGFASSLSIKYPSPYFDSYLSLSTSWRAPFVNELYSYGVHHSAASFEIGNSSLAPERTYQISFGLIEKKMKQIDFEISIYNNYIHHFIKLTPTIPVSTIKGVFPTFIYSQSNINMYGLEWTFSYHFNQKCYWSNQGNILKSFDFSTKNVVFGMPPARFSSDINYQIIKNEKQSIHATLEGVYTMKQKSDNQDYVPPPDAYFLLNADLFLESSIFKKPYKLSFSVQNLLNTKYRDYLNRNRYFADEAGRNISIRILFPFTI